MHHYCFITLLFLPKFNKNGHSKKCHFSVIKAFMNQGINLKLFILKQSQSSLVETDYMVLKKKKNI